ncbi:MAG: tetratricopeptide repeat protein [Verrucomicrobiales bacterium]|nr:tetratricopeptide repeat protein [Verrucomicrobiales bacterium]
MAEKLEQDGDYLGALNKYNEALPLQKGVHEEYPNFHPEIVKERLRMILEKQREIREKLKNQARGIPDTPPKMEEQVGPPNPVPSGARPGDTQQVGSGEFQLPKWPETNGGTTGNGFTPNRNPVQVAPPPTGAGVQNQNIMPPTGVPAPNVAGMSISEFYEYQMKVKDQQIAWLLQQKQLLDQKVGEKDRMLQQADVQLKQAMQNEANLLAQIRKLESSGGGGSNREAELKKLLDDAVKQVQDANARNQLLQSELAQARTEINQLRNRVAEIENDRDMALSMSGNDGGNEKLRELIEKNSKLREDLERIQSAADHFKQLDREKTEEIALLRSKINEVITERDAIAEQNAQYQSRIEDLQRQLTLLSDGLTNEEAMQIAEGNPMVAAENELLKGVILKQLQRQAQRKMATELLLAQLDKLEVRSQTLDALIADMANGVTLTESEKNMFKTPALNELIEESEKAANNYQPGTSTTVVVGGNGEVEEQALSMELQQVQQGARLAYMDKDFATAEKGYERYLEYRPNNVSCLYNLSLVKITLQKYEDAENYLQKAIKLKDDFGPAYYLLGRTYFNQGRHDEALDSLRTGLEHDPKNAKAHNCVGVISSQRGWVQQAEESFTQAVEIDPDYGDAHFNLAVLLAAGESPDDAPRVRTHYFKALHLGVPRDASIETFLKQRELSTPEGEITVGMVRGE